MAPEITVKPDAFDLALIQGLQNTQNLIVRNGDRGDPNLTPLNFTLDILDTLVNWITFSQNQGVVFVTDRREESA